MTPARASRRRRAMNTGTWAAKKPGTWSTSTRTHEAHRHRRDREAAADHVGLAHDVLDRQRRREVLRDHPRCSRASPA
jgi:hypothetical protein